MPSRYSWKGYLRLSLVSVPVQAVNVAVSGQGKVHMHMLHEPCHNRIRYQKVCPVHGEVPNDEIVYGYEFAKDQYAVVDDAEVDKLRSAADKAINIDAFVSPEHIDPMYFDGQSYVLLPDGAIALKPYAVLLKALAEQKLFGVGQAVFSGREQLVAVRPLGGMLGLEMLHFQSQLKPLESIIGDIKLPDVQREELRLANKLVEASTVKNFDLSQYHDTYTDKLRAVIDAKVAGKKIVGHPAEESPAVINLMDALRKSVKQQQTGRRTATKPGQGKKTARRRTTRRSAG